MRWQPSFWVQSRPIRTSHAETRPRTRSRSMSFVDPRVKAGVTFEVENFRIYGDLRKTETEVRNTLPTASTIQTEKTLLCFEKQRKSTPGDADYGDFYRCLSASVVSNSKPSTTQASPLTSTKGTRDGNNIKGGAETDRENVTGGQYLKVGQAIPGYLRNKS